MLSSDAGLPTNSVKIAFLSANFSLMLYWSGRSPSISIGSNISVSNKGSLPVVSTAKLVVTRLPVGFIIVALIS